MIDRVTDTIKANLKIYNVSDAMTEIYKSDDKVRKYLNHCKLEIHGLYKTLKQFSREHGKSAYRKLKVGSKLSKKLMASVAKEIRDCFDEGVLTLPKNITDKLICERVMLLKENKEGIFVKATKLVTEL